MPQIQQVHPTLAQLTAFGRGELEDDEQADVERHIAECEDCCRQLAALPDDTMLGLLRQPAGDTSLIPGRERRPESPAEHPTLLVSGDDTGLPPTTEASAGAHLPPALREHPRYHVVEHLGRGGMGDVYKAEHRLMNRIVALKVINRQLVRDEAAVRRFRREVQAAARLHHPNIVTAFDAEQAGDLHFLVMEFVDGVDLAEVVRRRGPLPVAEACEYIRQAAVGLQYAHERGMVHRDIKPQNLMVEGGGSSVGRPDRSAADVDSQPSTLNSQPSLKILDFGLASFATEAAAGAADETPEDLTAFPTASHLTLAGSMMGTPDYIAPEQARDAHAADIRADIYSLGCTLYFLLAGRVPFPSGSVLDKLNSHVEREPTPLAELRSDVPAELLGALQKMTAKSPAERYQTPAEVAAALEPFTHAAAGESAIDAARPRRSLGPSWLRRTLAAALLIGAAVLAGAIIYVETDKGTFVIEPADEHVAVMVGEKGVRIRDAASGREYLLQVGEHRIRSGEYMIDVSELPEGLAFSVPKFTLTRGGEERVTVFLQPKRDQDLLQGTWIAESGYRDGQPMALEEIGMQQAVFDGETLSVVMPQGITGKGVFELKDERDPKEIWIQVEDRSDGMRGIYKLEGDRLTLCMNQDRAGQVPTEFAAPAGTRIDLIVMRRPDTERMPSATVAPDEKRLQGKWVPIQAWYRGKEFSGEQRARMSITFDGNQATFTDPDGGPAQTGTFTIDTTRTPNRIDFIAPVDDERMPGILEFEGERLKLAMIDGDYARPTDFQPRDQTDHMVMVMERAPAAGTAPGPEERKVLKAAEAFLAVLDEGRFGQARDEMSSLAKGQATREQLSNTFQFLRDTFGKATQRTLQKIRILDEFPGLPEGRYAVVQFKSDHERRAGLSELLILNVDTDGQWRVNTYGNTLEPLPFPETKDEPQANAARQRSQAATPTPPPFLPAGVNLIHNSSLEDTPPGDLPHGLYRHLNAWTGWLDDGPNFRCRVVGGGRTGKQCLEIAGEGTRGVAFAGGVPLDRTKRYALKGWVRFEGGANARAVIKLNYFDSGKWLGVSDLVGVTSRDKDWTLLEKTDRADEFPEATLLVPTCHVEGDGRALFDDLELIAYERDKLPADFDQQHGKHNRLAGDLDFDRWVGCWESTTVYKPAANTPEEQTIKGEVVVRKLFDGQFLMWHWASEAGDQAYISLLALDEHVGGYHIWLFGSGGETYERTGQWDAAAQTLTLDLKPHAPGVTGTSTDRFVTDDRIESTLLIKADGQVTRDMRATWVRQSKEVPDGIPFSAHHAAEPTELEMLDKLTGEWTIRSQLKPSVWHPDGGEQTVVEEVNWILRGRFLMAQAFDPAGQRTNIWLATWEPREQAYRAWFFGPDLYGGQWRLSWDESSRGFHWRSIDMPAGWIGTGFNRWIDGDTFDSEALIKDEQGRVLLESQGKKSRTSAARGAE